MNIKDFNCCPHCNSENGYYQKYYASGWIRDAYLFAKDEWTGENIPENTEMWNSINISREGKYYHCIDCNKRICKVNED